MVGRHGLVDRLKTHPLMRAFRVDKMTLGAFEAVLRMVLQGRGEDLPTPRMLGLQEEELRLRARRLADRCRRVLRERGETGTVEILPVEGRGGGAGPFPPPPCRATRWP